MKYKPKVTSRQSLRMVCGNWIYLPSQAYLKINERTTREKITINWVFDTKWNKYNCNIQFCWMEISAFVWIKIRFFRAREITAITKIRMNNFEFQLKQITIVIENDCCALNGHAGKMKISLTLCVCGIMLFSNFCRI